MAGKVSKLAVSVAAFAVLVTGAAQADQTSAKRVGVQTMRDVAFRQEVAPTLAPFAHVIFCKSNRAECVGDGRGAVPVEATPENMQMIQRINLEVNRAIKPKADAPGPLGDVWNLAPARGDCEDYVLTKRYKLRQAGFPTGALRIAVTRTAAGEGHAVLIVSMAKGNLVLDNRTGKIVRWQDARLAMMKLQSAEDPKRWYTMNNAVAQNDRIVAERTQ